jgi:putative iron-regulated protein
MAIAQRYAVRSHRTCPCADRHANVRDSWLERNRARARCSLAVGCGQQKRLRRPLLALVALWIALAASDIAHAADPPRSDLASVQAVGEHYVLLAYRMYDDALRGARVLLREVEAFVAEPTPERHEAAKRAWIEARKAYSQTEALRFGNPNVDQWEGKVNAWPVDEGFLDYVHASYAYDLGNPHALENWIASDREITVKSLRLSHELGGVEPNVATGYHAIELLLWGQDLNEPRNAAGQRPASDFARGAACTGGSCERRAVYLVVATKLLISDLRDMFTDWRPGYGAYWDLFRELGAREQLRRMVSALGTMSAGELAGERLRAPLLAQAQEDEHSCFSDTTHLDLLFNVRGIQALYTGRYVRPSGEVVEGPSLSALVRARDLELDAALLRELDGSLAAARRLVRAVEAGEPFDRQIAPDSPSGGKHVRELADRLDAQTATLTRVEELLTGS